MLPMQGAQVQSFIKEDPTFHVAQQKLTSQIKITQFWKERKQQQKQY